jgi:hypothetical protein
VEPRGSEFASPRTTFETAEDVENPDPEGRIFRDRGEFIDVEIVTVPPVVEPGDVTRVHLVFRTIDERKAHWNNEAEEMVLWVDPPEGWATDARAYTHPIPLEPATTEDRTIEVEVRAPENPERGTVLIPAYALYYVCEDIDGLCVYRRQDLTLHVGVRR